MRGEIVIVRAFGDQPLVRRIWDVTDEAVFICDEQNYKALSEGRDGLWPVGFKHKDVFCYDAELARTLSSAVQTPTIEWSKLKLWNQVKQSLVLTGYSVSR